MPRLDDIAVVLAEARPGLQQAQVAFGVEGFGGFGFFEV